MLIISNPKSRHQKYAKRTPALVQEHQKISLTWVARLRGGVLLAKVDNTMSLGRDVHREALGIASLDGGCYSGSTLGCGSGCRLY